MTTHDASSFSTQAGIRFRAPAGTEPCASEGESLFGLTKHGASLSAPQRGVKGQLLPVFAEHPVALSGAETQKAEF
jgi:hypothetical protein